MEEHIDGERGMAALKIGESFHNQLNFKKTSKDWLILKHKLYCPEYKS